MLDPLSAVRGRDENDPLYREGIESIRTAAELRSYLAEREALDALVGLVEGDRLEMLRRTRTWMESRCHLLDRRRLVQESLAKVVVSGPTLDESLDLDEWLDTRIENAGQVLLEEDGRLAREGAPIEEPWEARFHFLMGTLAFQPHEVRRAMVAANGLRTGERHVFFNCFVKGIGFARYEECEGIDAEHARSLLMRAVDKLSDAVGDV